MNLIDAYVSMWKNAFQFSGRSRRSEYWFAYLGNIIVVLILSVLVAIADAFSIVMGLYELAIIIPTLALSIRRLHDITKSGWWLFIGLVPLVGGILLLIWACTDSTPGANQYGPNPKGYDPAYQQYGYNPQYQQTSYQPYQQPQKPNENNGPEL